MIAAARSILTDPPAAPMRLALRPAEAAKALGVCTKTMDRLIAAGTVPSLRVGGLRLIPVDGLRDWLRRKSEAPAGEGGAIVERSAERVPRDERG